MVGSEWMYIGRNQVGQAGGGAEGVKERRSACVCVCEGGGGGGGLGGALYLSKSRDIQRSHPIKP